MIVRYQITINKMILININNTAIIAIVTFVVAFALLAYLGFYLVENTRNGIVTFWLFMVCICGFSVYFSKSYTNSKKKVEENEVRRKTENIRKWVVDEETLNKKFYTNADRSIQMVDSVSSDTSLVFSGGKVVDVRNIIPIR